MLAPTATNKGNNDSNVGVSFGLDHSVLLADYRIVSRGLQERSD